MSLVSVTKLASQERVSGEKRVAVKPLLNVQCLPMSLEKVWQAILRQFWRYVRPRVNPKEGFDFNEILWSFLDQSRRWTPRITNVITLYRYPDDPLLSFSCSKRATITSKMKKKIPLERSRISFVSQTEEEMYCRQEKSYGGELVTQIFMILRYLNFSISILPVV